MKISAAIIARNEEQALPHCLNSLGWVDEIVVVDMASHDRTKEIARQFTPRVFSHPMVQAFDIAKKFAVEQTTGDWVLIIDADEVIPPALGSTLRAIATADQTDIVEISFCHYLLGTWIRHSGWGPTPMPRFFKKGRMAFSGTIHAYMSPDPAARRLRLDCREELSIQHFCYRDASHFLSKMNQYTTLEAENLFRQGHRFRLEHLILAPAREFFARFVRGRGFADGQTGLILCLLMALYRLIVRIKLWELCRNGRDGTTDPYVYQRSRVPGSSPPGLPSPRPGLPITACIICGTSPGAPYQNIEGFQFVRCPTCSLVYARNFFERPTIPYDDRYFQERHHYPVEPNQFEPTFGRLLDKIASFQPSGRLLDIGTGIGSLLVVARQRGFQTAGVEISPWASAFARERFGLDVRTGTLEEAKFAPASFEVIVLNHTLEHLPDPGAALREAHRLLADDGLLVIGVPNVASLMALLKGPRWASWQPGEHIWFFSRGSLSRLLHMTGFKVQHWEAQDSFPVVGYHPLQIIRRALNAVATWTDTGEAMLFFARKQHRNASLPSDHPPAVAPTTSRSGPQGPA